MNGLLGYAALGSFLLGAIPSTPAQAGTADIEILCYADTLEVRCFADDTEVRIPPDDGSVLL